MYHDYKALWNQGHMDPINQVQMFRLKSIFHDLSEIILIKRCVMSATVLALVDNLIIAYWDILIDRR